MSNLKRWRLVVELLLLYVAGPVVVYHLVYVRQVPLLALLPWALGAVVLLLILERDRSWLRTVFRLPKFADLLKVLGTFVILGGLLTLYARNAYPGRFLSFPERAPDLWQRVMVLYPAISVTTQEVLYRVFYFHRYAPLFGRDATLAIVFGAALFAFMHATLFAYRHEPFAWMAVAISFCGGLLFAWRFYKTRTLLTVAFEHALYGDLIFTIGLGALFFTGIANV